MTTEEYRQLWQEAIHLCEIETNKDEAVAFVYQYFDSNTYKFQAMDDRTLLLTFVGLVVYEKKFGLKFGSTTPAAFCYRELETRTRSLDWQFVYDVGDWAAEYSDNGYVPMGNYRGYGPRKYYSFLKEYTTRVYMEKIDKEERQEKKRAEGEAKVIAAKERAQERNRKIQELKEKPIDESIQAIENSGKSVFYYIELIEDWFSGKKLDQEQKERILSLFPDKSTRHNLRKKKHLQSLS